MNFWYFSENGYPYLPDDSKWNPLDGPLPSRYCDPVIVADLYDRYIDEYLAAEQAGFGLMINEHHQTIGNLNRSVGLLAAILVRLTSTARVLVLGHQLAYRNDPVRVAEEMAIVDNLARGRLEVGFVRGVAPDIAPTNANPIGTTERLWEAHDLIIRAWTTLDGPFNWESEHFQYRQVNVWPRIFTSPHPPIWITTSSAYHTREIAEHAYVCGTFLSGYSLAGKVFHSYRSDAVDAGKDLGPDRLAYAGMGFVADSDAAAREGAEQMMWFARQSHGGGTPSVLNRVPGYMPTNEMVTMLKGGQRREGQNVRSGSIDELIDNGILFCGTPDTVCTQIEEHYKRTGGYGHLVVLGQHGRSSHEETLRSIELFGREVIPNVQYLGREFSD